MKLVDVLDSKSCVGNHVPVRVRPSANKKTSKEVFLFEKDKEENRYAGSARASRGWSCFAIVLKTQRAKHGMPFKANKKSPAFGK